MSNDELKLLMEAEMLKLQPKSRAWYYWRGVAITLEHQKNPETTNEFWIKQVGKIASEIDAKEKENVK